MRAWVGGRRVSVGSAAVLAAVLAGGLPARADEMPDNVRLRQPPERMALAQAMRGAERKLADPQCQGLLDEFADASGRPLRAALDEQALGVGEYLGRVFFYDAPPAACDGTETLAGTHLAGSHVIRVCGHRFARAVRESSNHAEAVIIHEMLHSLGLGENPPTSDYITSRVMDRCRR